MNRLVRQDRSHEGTESVWFGCFSCCWIGIWVILLLPTAGFAQISPGELSKAHSSLEGALECAQCHTFGAGRPEFKCLECHSEIRERISAKQGYHARVADLSSREANCARCHSEHNGRDFDLIRWPTSRDKFDHREAGFTLEGRHASLNCQQCHRAQNLAPPKKVSAPKNPSHTFLGLSPRCVSCHRDIHQGALGTECSQCHSAAAWKPVSQFNHDSTKFSLTGLHQKVACDKCHRPSSSSSAVAKFKGIAFSDCTPCHADPHKGAFVAACGSCHTTAAWRQTRLTSNFDHQRTSFPLKGKHEAVACSKCHKTTNFKASINHGKCLDCHTDWHKGQFRARPDQGDCASCHSETGFQSATFTEASHKQTRFPLAGKHRSVACQKCHLPVGSDANYHPKHSACLDCHKDSHEGQFATLPHQNRCESCHTVEDFRASTFTISTHKKTRFALMGAHLAVACGDCHKPPSESKLQSSAKFHFPSLACASCHADPHRSQISQEGGKYDKVAGKKGCETCHALRAWKPAEGFDHEITGFSLTGAHRSVGCIRCHHDSNNNSSRLVTFEQAPQRCSGCHRDPHGGQFRQGEADTDCAKCHSDARWRPSSFDHENGASFSLAGAHQRVPCQQCHQTRNDDNTLIYSNVTKQCSGCHR